MLKFSKKIHYCFWVVFGYFLTFPALLQRLEAKQLVIIKLKVTKLMNLKTQSEILNNRRNILNLLLLGTVKFKFYIKISKKSTNPPIVQRTFGILQQFLFIHEKERQKKNNLIILLINLQTIITLIRQSLIQVLHLHYLLYIYISHRKRSKFFTEKKSKAQTKILPERYFLFYYLRGGYN